MKKAYRISILSLFVLFPLALVFDSPVLMIGAFLAFGSCVVTRIFSS